MANGRRVQSVPRRTWGTGEEDKARQMSAGSAIAVCGMLSLRERLARRVPLTVLNRSTERAPSAHIWATKPL